MLVNLFWTGVHAQYLQMGGYRLQCLPEEKEFIPSRFGRPTTTEYAGIGRDIHAMGHLLSPTFGVNLLPYNDNNRKWRTSIGWTWPWFFQREDVESREDRIYHAPRIGHDLLLRKCQKCAVSLPLFIFRGNIRDDSLLSVELYISLALWAGFMAHVLVHTSRPLHLHHNCRPSVRRCRNSPFNLSCCSAYAKDVRFSHCYDGVQDICLMFHFKSSFSSCPLRSTASGSPSVRIR